jgi:predicted 3-demethylubiquinone-9 3-methyltransferase (glyoxalase superfamily)
VDAVIMNTTQKISPMLWFDGEAEAAARHYAKAFNEGAITGIERYGKAGPGPEGEVMLVTIVLDGQTVSLLNGGPMFKPTEATSLVITCEDQAEVDRLWAHMSGGGSTSACGWLKDRWGFSWQIVPKRFLEIMSGSDAGAKARSFEAMMQMTKFDIAALEKAAKG